MSCVFSFSVKDVLGYARNEIIGNWFGRYLSSEDLEKFEKIRQSHCKTRLNIGQDETESFSLSM